jgi:uncharacterized cupredoxin-like copper-binding protein
MLAATHSTTMGAHPVRRSFIAVLLVAAVIGAAACGDAGDTGDTGDSGTTAVPPLESARTIELEMHDIAYMPTEITARRGELIRLVLQNRGALTHDFTVHEVPLEGLRTEGGLVAGGHAGHTRESAIHLALEAGTRGEIEFRATEGGEYEFYCDEPGHRDAGMRGVLRID